MNTKTSSEPECGQVCAQRQSSSMLLRQRSRVMRTESIALETLADQVEGLSPAAEETLWKLLINRRD